jgi:hypothetical protein
MPVSDSRITVKLHCLVGGRDEHVVIVCPGDERLGALLSLVAPECAIDPRAPLPGRKSWIIATPNGSWYTQGPFACDTRVGVIAEGASEVELFLEHTDLCMHGSPAVRGQGFLCGWC